jgi:iron complex outermembrane receptor protein
MKHLPLRRHSLAIAVSTHILALHVHADDPKLEVVEVRGQAIPTAGLSLDAGASAASRLGLSILDIPASVSIIDREAMAVKGDFSSLSAITRATGFAANASPGDGGSGTSVRGFNGHSAIVNTYDGTRLYVGSGTVSFPADTWTVDRIEVLRGPGSVINGVGAIGATVNYVTKKPFFDEFKNEVDLTAGSDALQRYAVDSGGQINDQTAYRLAAVYHKSDGYVDRDDQERKAILGSVQFNPNEDLQLLLSVDYADTEASTYFGTPLVNGEVPNNIRNNNYNVADSLVEYEDTWPRLHVDWQINDIATLRSDTFYMDTKRRWRNVEEYYYNDGNGMVDRVFYLEINHKQQQIGNRSDVLFDFNVGGMNNRLSVGAEINQIDFRHSNNSPYDGETTVDLLNPTPGHWADAGPSETTRDFDTDTLQYAVFLDDVLEINESWHVVAGIRQDEIDFDRKDVERSNGQPAAHIDTDYSGTSWRLGAVYKPNEDTSLYAQYSTAHDGIQSLLTISNPDLDLAEGEQYEVGFKQQLLDGKLDYTIALFDISKDNLISTDKGGVQRQIGKQSSKGAEFELFWLPLDVLSVQMNMAYADAEYDEFVSGSNDYSGNTPRSVPEKTANLWLTWQMFADWSIAGGARYVDERYLNDANTASLPDYTVYDATLQWQMNDKLRLSLRGKNLSDTSDFVLAPYGDQWILGDGRTVEFGVNYVF